MMALGSQAATVSIGWNRNPETDVVGYKVYWGPASTTPASALNVGNATNATVSGLQEGVTYDFYATAYNSAGLESELSAPVTYTVSSSTGSLLVSWERSFSPQASSYAVFYKPTNQTTFTRQSAGTNLTANIANVVRGTTYALTAEAINTSGSVVTEYETKNYTIPQSGSLGSVHLLPIDQPPSVVLTSPANGSNYTEPATIQINATANDDEAVQFVDLFAGTTRVARDTTPPYSFTWSNVPDGQYEIYAVAVDTLNQFTESETAVVTVQANTPTLTPPTAPQNLSGKFNRTTGAVRLAWTDTANNENTFAIERSLNGTSFGVIASAPANTQVFNDSTVQRGNRYYYRVRAVNAAGGNVSSTISVRIR